MHQDTVSQYIAALQSVVRSGVVSESKTLERANLAALLRLYQALAAGNAAALKNVLADDVELEIIGPAVVPFIGKWKTVDQVLAALVRNFGQVQNPRPEIVNFTAEGNSIVIVAREQGEAVATGKPYDIHWVQIFTFRDGKLCRIHEVADGLDLALAFTG